MQPAVLALAAAMLDAHVQDGGGAADQERSSVVAAAVKLLDMVEQQLQAGKGVEASRRQPSHGNGGSGGKGLLPLQLQLRFVAATLQRNERQQKAVLQVGRLARWDLRLDPAPASVQPDLRLNPHALSMQVSCPLLLLPCFSGPCGDAGRVRGPAGGAGGAVPGPRPALALPRNRSRPAGLHAEAGTGGLQEPARRGRGGTGGFGARDLCRDAVDYLWPPFLHLLA